MTSDYDAHLIAEADRYFSEREVPDFCLDCPEDHETCGSTARACAEATEADRLYDLRKDGEL